MQYINSRKYGIDTLFFRIMMAKDYFNAGVKYLQEIDFSNFDRLIFDWPPSVSFPATNLAFACELSMKSLMEFRYKSTIPRDHKLSLLFSNFPKNERQRIYKAFRNKNWRFKNLVRIAITAVPKSGEIKDMTLKSPELKGIEAFNQTLKKIDNHFVDSRYLYETKPGIDYEDCLIFPFEFMAQLSFLLLEECDAICRETSINLINNLADVKINYTENDYRIE